MQVGWRLFVAVIPALLGVGLVAALAYWGQYGRTAPGALLVVVLAASLASLVAAWRNTRYVAVCVERLAGPAPRPVAAAAATADERSEIGATVHGLSTAAVRAREDERRHTQAAEARATEYGEILDGVSRMVGARLTEARLPLYILLSSPFGALNENQEELIAAAQGALDAADAELRKMRKLIELDRGSVSAVVQPIGLAELLRPVLATAEARAAAARVQFRVRISSTAPRAVVEPALTREALSSMLAAAIARTPTGRGVAVAAGEVSDGQVRFTVTSGAHGGTATPEGDLEWLLARRLVESQEGVAHDDGVTAVVELPSELSAVTSPGARRGPRPHVSDADVH